MNVAWALCWGGSRSTKPCVFVKWLQPAMKGTSCVRRNIGLGYFKYGLCAGCFEALTTVCTEQDDTLAEQRCVALTDDGVHAAAMLLSAYRAGAGCRLSQADAAWVRNVIADSENFLPDLLREVP